MRCFVHFDCKCSFSPQPRGILEHRELPKVARECGVFPQFWLTNMLRATAACNFWTSQLPKWLRECGVGFCAHFDLQMCFSPQPRGNFGTSQLPKMANRECGVLCILTCKCAFRHSRVAFLEHRNLSKSGSENVVFLCILTCKCAFRHSRVAILEHRNFQNGSGNVVFCAFWLANVLFATAAWHFGTSELPKCLRRWDVFYILTRKCASRHSRVPFFTCPLNSYLRTRRFSEATFRTSGTTTHWKNTAIRDVTNIWRACWTPCYWLYTHVDLLATDSTRMLIFLLLTLHACWSSCYWHDCCSDSAFFNSTYCRKLDF